MPTSPETAAALPRLETPLVSVSTQGDFHDRAASKTAEKRARATARDSHRDARSDVSARWSSGQGSIKSFKRTELCPFFCFGQNASFFSRLIALPVTPACASLRHPFGAFRQEKYRAATKKMADMMHMRP